jgi:hypothetical protein
MGIATAEAAKWAGDSDDQEDFEVFPENALAIAVFVSMDTQWQWTGGMQSYRCGLNHSVLQLHMDKAGVPRKRRFDVMADVQTMERAALNVWSNAVSK